MFINGDWLDASEGETTSVINPATEEEIAEVPKGTAADVDRAVAAARTAFESWSQTTPQDRSKALYAFADAIEKDTDSLSLLEQQNVGKPKGTADFDVEFTVDNLRYFAGAARVIEGKAAAEYLSTHTSATPAQVESALKGAAVNTGTSSKDGAAIKRLNVAGF